MESWFDSWQGKESFLFMMIRLALGPTEPSVQWVHQAIFMWVNWLRHEADHSSSSSAESSICAIPVCLHSMHGDDCTHCMIYTTLIFTLYKRGVIHLHCTVHHYFTESFRDNLKITTRMKIS